MSTVSPATTEKATAGAVPMQPFDRLRLDVVGGRVAAAARSSPQVRHRPGQLRAVRASYDDLGVGDAARLAAGIGRIAHDRAGRAGAQVERDSRRDALTRRYGRIRVTGLADEGDRAIRIDVELPAVMADATGRAIAPAELDRYPVTGRLIDRLVRAALADEVGVGRTDGAEVGI